MSGPFGPRDDEEPTPPKPEELDEFLRADDEVFEQQKARAREDRAAHKTSRLSRASGPTWLVGVAALLAIVYITINSFTTESPGSRGIRDGDPLPPFTAPLALANLKCKDSDGKLADCDASVALKKRGTHPEACAIHLPDTLNACELAQKGPVALAFMVAPSDDCINQVDQLARLAPQVPGVQVAAIGIRGNHAKLNAIIRKHGWRFPVAYDHDGAVANIFAVAICPTITFAYKGGIVEHTTFGGVTDADVLEHLRAITRPPPAP